MATAPAVPRRRFVAQVGTIEGGLLHGWGYAFLRMIVKQSRVYMDLRCTEPGWPFPRMVRFTSGDFHRLVPAAGSARVEITSLIAEAKELAAAGSKQ